MSDTLRVLIVEDVPTDAELMECELQDAGMTFSSKRAATKKAYIAALSTFLPQVILSDYSLPAFDGLTALKLRQEVAPDTPFIFVTGALGEDLAIDLLKQGATDYVLKSRLSRLPAAVNRALREVEERKDRERAQTDLKQAQNELLSHLQFFQNMDRINRAMQGTNDLEQMTRDVLDAMLSVFECDRAFLVYPCDPDAPSFEAIMERTRPGYSARRGPFPADSDNAKHFQLYLASSGAVTLGPGCDYPLEISHFSEKSKMMTALYPKTGKPWVLGMHQCSYPRVWSEGEKKLLGEIARRMGDVLTSLLAYRDLHESEERHRVTLQTAMDGLFRADTQGRILEVNETYCRMSGYSEQELLTMNVVDIEAAPSAEMIAANIRSFAELGPKRFESLHRRKDGSLFDVEISVQFQSIAGGQIVVFVRDITERKRIEQSLRQSEAFLAEAQRLSHTGSWAFDLASGKFVYASEECLRIYEHDAQEALPTREATFRLIHPADRDSVQEGFEKSLRKKVDTSSEFRLALPSGTVKHVQATRHPVLNDAGDVVQLVGTTIDITVRKRAEKAIHQTEKQLRDAIDTIPALVWSTLPDGSVDFVNRRIAEFCGLSFDPASGEVWQSVIHPEDLDRYLTRRRAAVASGQGFEVEARVRRADGEYRWLLFRSVPMRDETGTVVKRYGVSTDIDDRRRAEQAHKRSEEALRLASAYNRSLIEASLDPLVTIDKEGKISDVNAATEQVTGYERSELIGTDFSDSFTEPEKARAGYKQVFDQGFVRDFELNIRHRDGRITPVLYNASVYRDEAGNPIGVFAAARDIRERKRAEAEINSLKNYLSNIIDSMPSVLVGMDNTYSVTQWNRQAEAFTGIPAGEAMGKPIADLLPDFAPWIMMMGTGLDEHRPLSMEKLLIEKEAERRFYDLMLYPLSTQAVGGAVLRVEDVTERARIQELMVQTEKMMSIGGLAAGMAHEINNPLGIITQAAQNIERRISLELPANRKVSEELGLKLEGIRAYFEKRQLPEAIASIRTASSRAAKIVANMLQFSRRADTTLEFTSLAQIVDQALELAASDYDLKKKYDFRSIEIIKDYQDTPQVPIVAVEIEQVLLNLLNNAAQAMIASPPDRRPSIIFRLRCEDRYAVLEVEDNGPGMTEDVRRRVFEPFFTTKEPGVGTGLGLSVSYVIVTQNHKGLIEVQSTPDRGTVFKVRLPIGRSET